jgi:hypothetical protein
MHRNKSYSITPSASASSEGLAQIGDIHLVVGQPGSPPMPLIPSAHVRVVAAAT